MCVLPLVIPVGGFQVSMEWLACRHGRCWWRCATQILWDPFYSLSAHPQLLLRKLLLTSVTFSRRLALAKWNCFARKFWELYHSTHSSWCPVVTNRLGLGVTKALLLFFMAGWTLPGNLCPTAPHGIGMKLHVTQIHIPFPFFPCPILLPSLSFSWEPSLNNSCAWWLVSVLQLFLCTIPETDPIFKRKSCWLPTKFQQGLF